MSETIHGTPAEIPADDPESKVTETPKKGIRWSTILVWAGVAAILGLLAFGLTNANKTRPQAGQVAPSFEMQFFDGYEWKGISNASLEDMRGNVVVLNFWASWCVECRYEAELLENTWRQYRDQGVIFLGVAYVDSEPKSLAYLEDFDITYPNAPDLGSSVSDNYQITGVPETFFIDKNGQVAFTKIGPIGATELNNQIASLLAQ